MNIAYILHSTIPTEGAAKAFLSLLKEMSKFHTGIIIMPDKQRLFQKLTDAGHQCYAVPYRANIYPPCCTWKDRFLFLPRIVAHWVMNKVAVTKITRYLQDKGIDLIHTNVGVMDVGFRVSRKLKLPHLYHIREYGDIDFGMHYFPCKKSFLRQLSASQSYSICITRDIQVHHQQKDKPNSRVIYDGVMSVKRTLPAIQKKKYFLYAGRIEPAKGLDLLLEAYADYASRISDPFPLYVAGLASNPTFFAVIQQTVRLHRLDPYIHFVGDRDDISHLMQEAYAIIIPSRSEGFGLCMPEAMFNGCLAIAHNTGGTKEQLDNGFRQQNAEIALRYDSPEQLTQYLLSVSSQPLENFAPSVSRAFQTVNELYTTEQNAEQVNQFYQEILQQSSVISKKINSSILQ